LVEGACGYAMRPARGVVSVVVASEIYNLWVHSGAPMADGRWDEALEAVRSIEENLVREDNVSDLDYMGFVLTNLALEMAWADHAERAEQSLGLVVERLLGETDPVLRQRLAAALYHRSAILRNSGRTAEADEVDAMLLVDYGEDALASFTAEAAKSQANDLHQWGVASRRKAEVLVNLNRFAEADSVLEEILLRCGGSDDESVRAVAVNAEAMRLAARSVAEAPFRQPDAAFAERLLSQGRVEEARAYWSRIAERLQPGHPVRDLDDGTFALGRIAHWAQSRGALADALEIHGAIATVLEDAESEPLRRRRAWSLFVGQGLQEGLGLDPVTGLEPEWSLTDLMGALDERVLEATVHTDVESRRERCALLVLKANLLAQSGDEEQAGEVATEILRSYEADDDEIVGVALAELQVPPAD
jgi:tetratricopeptide (TPR) repeat protein